MLIQAKLVQVGKYDTYIQKLLKQPDFEHQVKVSLEALIDIIPLDVNCEHKTSAKSNDLRQEADRSFFKEKGNKSGLLQAWKIYSTSVAYAENDSRELSLAYANRSAILYNLHKYEECTRDINKALQSNYPDSLRANLLRRKAKCLKMLGKPEANDVCQEARQWLENLSLNEKSKEKLEDKIQCATKVTAQNFEASSSRKSLPNIATNNRIPCASSAIDIVYNERYGKHVIAARDINVGEVLVIEKPYALILKPECIYTHCSHCFARAWDSIPCPNCVYAMYCSESCRDEAWKQYHDIECSVKGYFLNLQMNDLAPFSLRLLVLAIREAGSIEQLEKELKKINDCKDSLEKCLSDGVYRSDIYRPVYCLQTHKNKRPATEVVAMLLNSAVITYYISTCNSLFGKNLDNNVGQLLENKNVLFIAQQLVHHYMLIQINDHDFAEVDRTANNIQLGTVIYPFCSIFNHSCNPNITRVPGMGNDNKPIQMMLALQPIKEGAQIFDDYGFDFSTEPLSKRKAFYRPYHFSCECKACIDDWPSVEALQPLLSTPATKERKAELKKLVKKIPIYQKIILEAEISYIHSESESILSTLAQMITTSFNHSSQPTRELFQSIMLFRQAFSLIYGNRYNV